MWATARLILYFGLFLVCCALHVNKVSTKRKAKNRSMKQCMIADTNALLREELSPQMKPVKLCLCVVIGEEPEQVEDGTI